MRTTIALDDELVAKAQAFTGMTEKSSLSARRSRR
jgi:Arc/MetJ family transcription regulator